MSADGVHVLETEPYCDVCGKAGAELRTAVEVCRDCLDGERHAREVLISALAAEQARTDVLVREADALLRFHEGDYAIQCAPVEDAILAIQKARGS